MTIDSTPNYAYVANYAYVVKRLCARRKIEVQAIETTGGLLRFDLLWPDIPARVPCEVPFSRLRYGHETVEVIAMEIDLAILAMRSKNGDAAPMTFTGPMRVHFNRHGAAPLVWCVATDDWELAVASVAIDVPVESVYQPKTTADDEDGKPSAWLAVTGTLVVVGNTARISRAP